MKENATLESGENQFQPRMVRVGVVYVLEAQFGRFEIAKYSKTVARYNIAEQKCIIDLTVE